MLPVNPLLSKSTQSIQAAEKLIETEHYNSSVHCSYYHCLQFMSYLATEKFGWTEDELKKKAKADKGSHQALIKIISEYLTGNHSIYMNFNKKFGRLKMARESADYHFEIAEKSKAIAVRDLSKETLQLLKTNLTR